MGSKMAEVVKLGNKPLVSDHVGGTVLQITRKGVHVDTWRT